MDFGFNTEIITTPIMKSFLILIISFVVTVIISILRQRNYKKINYLPTWKFLGEYLRVRFLLWLIQLFLNTSLYIGISFINFANPHSLPEIFIMGTLSLLEEFIALAFTGLSAKSLHNEYFKGLSFMETKDYTLFSAITGTVIFIQIYLVISTLHNL